MRHKAPDSVIAAIPTDAAPPYPDFDGTQACAKGDPINLWFPPDDIRAHPLRDPAAEATRACQGCTFRAECLSYAVWYDVDGIWGGMNKKQRSTLARHLRIKQKSLEIIFA